MTKETIKNKLITMLAVLFDGRNFDIETIEGRDLIGDLGMDSMFFMSMIIKIEDEFNFEVPDSILIMNNFSDVNGIADIIYNVISNEQCFHTKLGATPV